LLWFINDWQGFIAILYNESKQNMLAYQGKANKDEQHFCEKRHRPRSRHLMLNNTGDPRQWIYFRNLKKETLVMSGFHFADLQALAAKVHKCTP
jgi:hypothetical protein